ncbi:MAG: hypothetical protein ACK56G_20105 [Pirellulaceae bacterium]
MIQLKTNRDLYVAIQDLCRTHKTQVPDEVDTNLLTRAWRFLTGQTKNGGKKFHSRDLEEYLRALWQGAGRFRDQNSLSLDEFYGLIASAYTDPAPPFRESWRSSQATIGTNDLAACLEVKMGLKAPTLEDEDDEVCRFEEWERFLIGRMVDLREMSEQGILEQDGIWGGVESPRGHSWYNFSTPSYLECATQGSFGGWISGEDEGRILTLGPSVAAPRNPVVDLSEIRWEDFQLFLACGQYYE